MNKTKIIITTLDEFGEEKGMKVLQFITTEELNKYLEEHEQEFADNPDIYAVYVN
jgi:hypothetical protein